MSDGILFFGLLKVSSVVLVFKNAGAELLGLLKVLGLLKLKHLIYPRLLPGLRMLVFFKKLRLMEFWVRFMALFGLFLVIEGLNVVLDGKSSEEYPFTAGIPQGFILVTHFSHHTLMAFLMMLSVILLLMMVLSKSDQACDKWQ